MFRRFGMKLTDAPGWLTKVVTASSEAGGSTNAAEKQIAVARAAGVTDRASDDSSRLSLELAYRGVGALRRPWVPIAVTEVTAVRALLRATRLLDAATRAAGTTRSW